MNIPGNQTTVHRGHQGGRTIDAGGPKRDRRGQTIDLPTIEKEGPTINEGNLTVDKEGLTTDQRGQTINQERQNIVQENLGTENRKLSQDHEDQGINRGHLRIDRRAPNINQGEPRIDRANPRINQGDPRLSPGEPKTDHLVKFYVDHQKVAAEDRPRKVQINRQGPQENRGIPSS